MVEIYSTVQSIHIHSYVSISRLGRYVPGRSPPGRPGHAESVRPGRPVGSTGLGLELVLNRNAPMKSPETGPPEANQVPFNEELASSASVSRSSSPSYIPFMGLRGRGNFRLSLPGLTAITYAKRNPSRLSMSF